MVGVLPDVTKRATMNLKGEGQTLYLIGEHADSIGASQYLETVHGLEAGHVPTLDLSREQAVIDATLHLIRAGLTDTAHDCAEGGLAVALAEMAIAGNTGLNVTLDAPQETRADALLYGEAHARILIATPDEAGTEAALQAQGVPFARLGTSGGDTVTIALPAHHVHLSVTVNALAHAFNTPLAEILG